MEISIISWKIGRSGNTGSHLHRAATAKWWVSSGLPQSSPFQIFLYQHTALTYVIWLAPIASEFAILHYGIKKKDI